MARTVAHLVAVLLVTAGFMYGGDDDRRKRNERALRTLQSRAERISPPAPGDSLGTFLSHETRRLSERSRALPIESYQLHRVLEALEDLLDARERLLDTRPSHGGGGKDGKKQPNRDDTAQRLERAYFRVQQADYFGRLGGDSQAAEYILRARQLYQQARSAYDRREYGQAVKLAAVSTELVNVLENIAQAAARRPDPPVLR